MNIALSPEMQRFIEEKVNTGQFGSPTEVVVGALTVLRESETLTPEAVSELRRELRIGIDQLDQGLGEPWNVEDLKTKVRQNAAFRKGH